MLGSKVSVFRHSYLTVVFKKMFGEQQLLMAIVAICTPFVLRRHCINAVKKHKGLTIPRKIYL
jgi:hypothetical protein